MKLLLAFAISFLAAVCDGQVLNFVFNSPTTNNSLLTPVSYAKPSYWKLSELTNGSNWVVISTNIPLVEIIGTNYYGYFSLSNVSQGLHTYRANASTAGLPDGPVSLSISTNLPGYLMVVYVFSSTNISGPWTNRAKVSLPLSPSQKPQEFLKAYVAVTNQ